MKHVGSLRKGTEPDKKNRGGESVIYYQNVFVPCGTIPGRWVKNIARVIQNSLCVLTSLWMEFYPSHLYNIAHC